MSYQLEREMLDRVTRYRTEAALWRAVPHREFRRKLAITLRMIADRIEHGGMASPLAGERTHVALHGRNH